MHNFALSLTLGWEELEMATSFLLGCCIAQAPTSSVLFQQLGCCGKPAGESHQPQEWGAAGGSGVGVDVDPYPESDGQLQTASGSCQWRGLPTPGWGGEVLAHPPGQAEGGVAAGQGTVTSWTRMLLTTYHVQDRMPGQGVCSLQSALGLCRLIGETTHVGACF